ncbi:MAG: type II toxin-antitoxin system PemK/MazF family toxin [Ilumatobacteraceae bacterium]
MQRGEVWWLEEPNSKRRPALVLTRQVLLDRLSQVTVAASTTRRRNLPTEVDPAVEHGMPRPCVVSLDNLHTIFRGLLTECTTTLDEATMSQICLALRVAVAW